MQSGGQGYLSMADNEGRAASSENASFFKTLDPVAGVPNRIVLEYCTRYWRLLDVRRFAGTFLDGRSKTIADR